MTRGYDVYRWESGQHYHQHMVHDEAAMAAAETFLRAHGINPRAFVIGNQLEVRRHEDGTLWLHTWRTIGNVPVSDAPTCPHCHGCLQQEPVEVPLAEPVPMLPGAWVADGEDVPTVEVAGEVTG